MTQRGQYLQETRSVAVLRKVQNGGKPSPLEMSGMGVSGKEASEA